ncbi:MAG: 50S ribosomal protein L32 [Bifidobacteriaceae bacterium]|nr:50S ribosomal protein L32 [Bifidobacteriaceae bacterium]
MAVPKRKMSRANTRARRSQWKTSAAALTRCPRCSQPTRPHTACPSCGTYKGRYYSAAVRSEFEA